MKILDIQKLGFCAYTVPKKKEFKVPEYKDIISYEKEKYDFFNRTIMMDEYILQVAQKKRPVSYKYFLQLVGFVYLL